VAGHGLLPVVLVDMADLAVLVVVPVQQEVLV
jgi:hypothetical protein